MSWLTSYCPRCHGMLIVPASFVGHSIICDKCGVTFIAMPAPQQQYAAPQPPLPQQMPPPMQMPMQMPQAYQMPPPQSQPQPLPQHPPQPMPYQAPPPPRSQPPAPQAPYGYGAPPYSAPPGNAPSGRDAPYEATSMSLNIPSLESAPLPLIGGQRNAPHPFGNLLPEIEILPPPKAKRQSSRKRSGESKRMRRRSSGDRASGDRSSRDRSMRTAPPPLPGSTPGAPPPLPQAAGRISHTALARADHGATGEVGEIELRIRRAQLRRTISLAVAVVGLAAMSVMGLLMIKYVKPGSEAPPEAGPTELPPAATPMETTPPPEPAATSEAPSA